MQNHSDVQTYSITILDHIKKEKRKKKRLNSFSIQVSFITDVYANVSIEPTWRLNKMCRPRSYMTSSLSNLLRQVEDIKNVRN